METKQLQKFMAWFNTSFVPWLKDWYTCEYIGGSIQIKKIKFSNFMIGTPITEIIRVANELNLTVCFEAINEKPVIIIS